jgi:hypothetical protein
VVPSVRVPRHPARHLLCRLAHEPFGWRPTTLAVTVRRYRCEGCRHVLRQDMTKVAASRARISLGWAAVSAAGDRVPPPDRRSGRGGPRRVVERHCCVVRSCDAVGRGDGVWSDRGGEFVERGGDAELLVSRLDAQFVVASSDVLYEGVTADDHTCSAVGLEAAHRA